MTNIGSRFVTAMAAIAILGTSTASMAAAAPAGPPQVRDPWLTLSMMTPVGASTLSQTAVAAAAQLEGPPPPPPEAYQRQGRDEFHVPLAVIAVWLADIALMIYIATRDDDNDQVPGVSPT